MALTRVSIVIYILSFILQLFEYTVNFKRRSLIEVQILVASKKDKVLRWLLWGIPVLILLGSPVHFLYDWLGKPEWVAIFAPVNESVWEHLKLQLWPMAIWWLIGYFVVRKHTIFLSHNWWVAAFVGQITNILVILTFFYTYTGALGFESLVMDIFSMVLAVVLSQTLAMHVYRYGRAGLPYAIASAVLILVLLILFAVTTFAPPHIPLFQDSPTGGYGILH